MLENVNTKRQLDEKDKTICS